jgi:excisionase family DNA binding protein
MEGVRTVQHERLTIQEAAHRLGVSESAVRKRIKRGTLQREKTEDGRVLVYMEPSVPGAEEVRTPERDALISEMQQRLALLERELDVRTEEIRRRDTIIMNMTEAMKALNPPAPEDSSEARDSPESSGPSGELGALREELGTERTRREMAESTLHEGMAEEQRRREKAERERDNLRRELFALREAPESPEAAEEQQGRGQPHSATVESQEGTQPRSWWRRVFGG